MKQRSAKGSFRAQAWRAISSLLLCTIEKKKEPLPGENLSDISYHYTGDTQDLLKVRLPVRKPVTALTHPETGPGEGWWQEFEYKGEL